MSNFKVVYYNDQNSGHKSSVIDVEIGRSTNMIGVNKSGLKRGNIVAVVNSANNLVQIVRIKSRENWAQPWKHEYKNVFNVEPVLEDILVTKKDKEKIFLNDKGVRTQWPTVSAQEKFVKVVLSNA